MEPKHRSVAEGRQTDELRQDRLWFLESMDRVNEAIQDTDGLQQTTHVLDAVLSIFGLSAGIRETFVFIEFP